MKTTLFFTLFLGVVCFTNAQEIHIPAIPHTLSFENTVADYKVKGSDKIQFSSPAKSDLFISSNGQYATNKSPRLLFTPEDEFMLSAKISLEFFANWDAGDLVVYNDSLNWAKFCFERDFQGNARVVSVVCKDFADDCNGMRIEGNEIYYKVAGKISKNRYVFYYSLDGEEWFPIRMFGMGKSENLRIGFSVQSPVGEGSTAVFSDIKYQAQKPKNWQLGK